MKFRESYLKFADLDRYDNDLDISSHQLTSLDGCPKEIVGNFWCYNNHLSSLIGGPEKVGNGYSCYGNNLTSLDGIASYIGSGLDFEYNQIESIKGIHKQIKFLGGNVIWISRSTTKGLLDLFLLNAPNLEYLRGNNEINGIFTKYFELIRQGEMSNLEAMLECQSELIEKNLDRYIE